MRCRDTEGDRSLFLHYSAAVLHLVSQLGNASHTGRNIQCRLQSASARHDGGGRCAIDKPKPVSTERVL